MSEIEHRKELEVLWTVPQAARYLVLSRFTVYRWVKTGKVFDPTKIVHFANRVRIPRSEVERIVGEIKKGLQDKA